MVKGSEGFSVSMRGLSKGEDIDKAGHRKTIQRRTYTIDIDWDTMQA